MNIYKAVVMILVSFNSFGLTVVKDPDLSNSTSAIYERQKELMFQLDVLSNHESYYLRSEAFGKLAQFYHVHDFIEESLMLYDNALELAPKNSKWHYLKAMALRNKGDTVTAKQSLLKAWEYNKEYLPTMVYLAEEYFKEGLLQEAKKAYKVVLKKHPEYPRALTGLGQVLVQEGEAQEALELYKLAIKAQPLATQINFLISQAYAALGDFEEAKKYSEFKGAIQAQMDDPIVRELYAESRSATYYNDKAIKAYRARDFQTSEIWAKRALEYEPKSPYPKVTLANIYVSTNRTEQAAELLKTVVAQNESDPNLKYSLGVIEEILDNNEKSIYWYKKTLELDSNHKRASVTLSNALMRSGDYSSALIRLKEANVLDPQNAYVIHRMAAIKAHFNSCEESVDLIYKAIRIQPKNFAFLLTLAKIAVHCQVENQVSQDALNAIRNIYQISQDIYILKVLAMIEAKVGNFQDAIDFQSQAIFQLLSNSGDATKMEIDNLKMNLELYKQNKYPVNLFGRADIDLNPESFNKVK